MTGRMKKKKDCSKTKTKYESVELEDASLPGIGTATLKKIGSQGQLGVDERGQSIDIKGREGEGRN